ncbi:MAG: hypothetical protein WCI22_00825 [Actinomycetota bacterium]
MKRLTWFIGGAVAGVAGAGLAKQKVKQAAVDFAPANVAHKAAQHLKDAFREGRRAMRAKEAELRAQRDGRAVSLADEVEEGDQVLVDGRPVEPGQVIVLRQVREQRAQAPRRRDRA